MAEQNKAKRIDELYKKSLSPGGVTSDEADELKKLLSEKIADQKANPSKNLSETNATRWEKKPAEEKQKEFDEGKVKAAEKENKAKIAQADIDQLKDPLSARPEVKEVTPEMMKTNPATIAPGFGQTPSGDVVKLPPAGQTGKENPALYKTEMGPVPSAPTAEVKPEAITPKNNITPTSNPAYQYSAPDEMAYQKSEQKGQGFGDMLSGLAKNYGVPLLDILQAVGYQRGGITAPTNLQNKYTEGLRQKERDFAAKLEADRAARDEAAYQKRNADQRAWEEQQAQENRAYQKKLSDAEIASREKIAGMGLLGGSPMFSASLLPQ